MSDLFFGTTGADTGLEGNQVGSIVFAGGAADTITGKVPNNPVNPTTGNTYFGGGGADTIYVQEGDRAFGGNGDDEIWNIGGKNNQLFGGAGQDKIYSGAGDILVGGGDADEFWFVQIPPSDNTILDFNRIEDKIVIDATTGITKEALVLDTTTSAGDTLLKFGDLILSTVKGITIKKDDADFDNVIVIDSFLTEDNAPNGFLGAVPINLSITGASVKEGSIDGSFGNRDQLDMYKIILNDPSDITIDLTGLFPSSDASIFLLKDDGDGEPELSDGSDPVPNGSSQNQGNADEQISVSGLAAGEYFIFLQQVVGFSNYTLSVTATANFVAGLTEDAFGQTYDSAGKLDSDPNTEGQQALIAGTSVTQTGSFSSNDTVDLLSFVIDNTANVKVTLSGDFNNFNYADLFAIKDDGDEVLELNDGSDLLLSVQPDPDTAPVAATQEFTISNLAAGTYYVSINHVLGAANYDLTVEIV